MKNDFKILSLSLSLFFFSSGVTEIDQIVTVLLSTSMAVGCIVPLILDNTIPGTIEERGLAGWGENPATDEPVDEKYEVAPIEVYNLPFGLHRLSKFEIAKYMPFLPYPYDNGRNQEEQQERYTQDTRM